MTRRREKLLLMSDKMKGNWMKVTGNVIDCRKHKKPQIYLLTLSTHHQIIDKLIFTA